MNKPTKIFLYVLLTVSMIFSINCLAHAKETPESDDLHYCLLGDVDRNGKIETSDARTALRFSTSLEIPTAEESIFADFNKNGKIESSDARSILRVAVQLDKMAEHTLSSAATCTTAQTCTICNAIVVEALGHTPGDPATCTTAQICTVCDEVLVEALGHTPGDPATCTTAQVCTVCDEVLAEALGHTPGDPATCTTAQICTVCDEVLVEALGHTPGDPATCTTAQLCTVCDEVLAEALGHNHERNTVAPTCTENGYDILVCSICSDSYIPADSVTVAALGHTPGAEATRETDQICTVCNTVLQERIGYLSFESFNTDIYSILTNETTDVTFSAVCVAETVIPYVTVADENSNVVGTLYDDGEHNDQSANDGIFANIIELYNDTDENIMYHAEYDGCKSSEAMITFYTPYTEEEISIHQTACSEILEIESEYLNDEGFVDEDNISAVFAAIEEYGNLLVANGDATECTATSSYVSIIFESGLDYYYTPNTEGFDSNENSLRIVTIQPFDASQNCESMDSVASSIANNLSYYTFDSSDDVDDLEATLTNISLAMKDASIVMWSGHGGWFGSQTGSVLATGAPADWSNMYTSAGIPGIHTGSSDGESRICIDSSFFASQWFSDMNNAVVYLGTCHSGGDDVGNENHNLANTLRSRGASTVFVNSDTIHTSYDQEMLKSVFNYMNTKNPATNKLYTAAEALALAQNDNGSIDSFRDGGFLFFGGRQVNCYVYIVGEKTRRLDTSYITGTIKSEKTKETIRNARINICGTNEAGEYVNKTYYSKSNGNFYAFLPAGTYTVTISAYGFYTRVLQNVILTDNQVTYISQSALLTPMDIGSVAGYVYNSMTGAAVSNATIRFRLNHGNTTGSYITDENGNIFELTTNQSGYYYTEDLPFGYYTAEASKEDFATSYLDVSTILNTTSQDIVMSPILENGYYQVVLTWGENPRDLDSHMTGTRSDGSTFHVYYSNKNAYDGDINVVNLDHDDTTSYGPETITLIPTTTDTYMYYVYHYSGSGSISTSDATVRVYKDGELIRTYYAPTDQGTGRYWTVFQIDNGYISEHNSIDDSVADPIIVVELN